jgi:hypothetical protein
VTSEKTQTDAALVHEFVTKAHGDFDGVREMLAANPSLVNATWDWGDGDWETALGGAAHMGRRDIALHLLANGARLDLFAVAMLGYLDVVKAAVAVDASVVDVLGPHGIPLIAHAEAGSDHAADVLAFLRART